ncbi:MAG: LacI family DNA-binding transcriptional regulator [Pirellulales bacterium]|nr:LacI family DNA-binding transcriptional regulator [Pirellulales bacterium]
MSDAKKTLARGGAPHRHPTLTDVARLAGVSRSVAGRVLNGGTGNTRFSDQAADAVREAAARLQYRPNHAARQLRGKRSRTFGVLVASVGDPLLTFLVQHIDAAAVSIGCRTLLANTIGNPDVGPDQFDYHVDDFARRGVDGVVCAVHDWCEGDRRALLQRHPNTVFYEDPGMEGAACVVPDRAEAVRLAVRHAASRGRRRIGLAVMALSRPTGQERLAGYRAEADARGLPWDERLIFDGEPHGLGYARHNSQTRQWEFPVELMDRVIDALVRDAGADAVVAHNDFWAAALMRRMRRRGIRVPDDVAVVGYLNHYLADWTDPPLTSIDPMQTVAGQKLVEILEQGASGDAPAADGVTFRVAPRLIERQSA